MSLNEIRHENNLCKCVSIMYDRSVWLNFVVNLWLNLSKYDWSEFEMHENNIYKYTAEFRIHSLGAIIFKV